MYMIYILRGVFFMSDSYKKMFHLLMKSSLFTALNKKAAQMQIETGNKVSITSLINQVLTDYVKEKE